MLVLQKTSYEIHPNIKKKSKPHKPQKTMNSLNSSGLETWAVKPMTGHLIAVSIIHPTDQEGGSR